MLYTLFRCFCLFQLLAVSEIVLRFAYDVYVAILPEMVSSPDTISRTVVAWVSYVNWFMIANTPNNRDEGRQQHDLDIIYPDIGWLEGCDSMALGVVRASPPDSRRRSAATHPTNGSTISRTLQKVHYHRCTRSV